MMSSAETHAPLIENRILFESRLKEFTEEDFDFIMYAYDFAKFAHKGEFRQGGARYFEHPRAVALILIDECGIRDRDIIAGGLLHDVAEDTPAFGSAIRKTYAKWKPKTSAKIIDIFNPSVSEIVMSVTKPPKLLIDLTELERDGINISTLSSASSKAILVKMADRLHNLCTLGDTPKEKQIRKVKETIEHYFPLFETISSIYPDEYSYMRGQMDQAISNLNF